MKLSRHDNKIVVSLKHVSYARFYYQNQYEQKRNLLPDNKDSFSVRGEWHNKNENHVQGGNLYEFALKRGLLDIWIPHLYLQLTANHSLIYSGSKAESIYAKWCEMQFSRKKKL